MDTIADQARELGFSGVLRVDGRCALEAGFGLADRAASIANTVDTRFAVASGSKTVTAIVVLRLVADGALTLETPARSLLGPDLPLIDDGVTVAQLLAHRSGIGDYLDESVTDPLGYVMTRPIHVYDTTAAYVGDLDGHPQVSAPGERFAYCNAGYVVLALLAERAGGQGFHDLADELVLGPAAMASSGYFRSDELPSGCAVGYLGVDNPRTNIHHLPVRGNGDGGMYTTAADVHRLWAALFDGSLLPEALVAEMTTPKGATGMRSGYGYGWGCWIPPTGGIEMEGADVGSSFRSVRLDDRRVYTVLSNVTDGAWPIAALLDTALRARR